MDFILIVIKKLIKFMVMRKIKKPQNKKLGINNNQKSNDTKKLWFVNLGGYHLRSM